MAFLAELLAAGHVLSGFAVSDTIFRVPLCLRALAAAAAAADVRGCTSGDMT